MSAYSPTSPFAAWFNKIMRVDLFGVPEGAVKQALNRSLLRSAPFILLSIGVLFWLYAFVESWILQESGTLLIPLLAILSGGLVLLTRQAIVREKLPLARADLMSGLISALVLGNMLLRLMINDDPKQTANLVLFMVTIAVLLFSTEWVIALILTTLGGWLASVYLLSPSTEWLYYGILMGTSAIMAFIAHSARLRSYKQTEILRITDQRQREEIHRQAVQIEMNSALGQELTAAANDLNLMLEQVTKLIRDRYPKFFIGVYLPNRQAAHAVEKGRAPQKSAVPKRVELEIGAHGIIATALASGETLLFNDLLQAPNLVENEVVPGTKAQLALPLKIGARIIGVLDLQADTTKAFAEKDLPVYQLLADQLAVALSNAQLYKQTREFNAELESLVAERTSALCETYNRLEKIDQTKSDFINIVSHELLTPLTVIRFNSQLMQEDALFDDMPEAMQKWAHGIDGGVDRISEIVSGMLEMAKIEQDVLEIFPESLSVAQLLKGIKAELAPDLAGRGQTLTFEHLDKLPLLEVDPTALRRVMVNLLSNAIKYTPDGGQIEVAGRLCIEGGQKQVELTVRDTGIGIDPELHEVIFDKFYQTGKVLSHATGKCSFKGGGPGLGLPIARGLVQAHGGQIWVESAGTDETELPGSAFHVQLPLTQRQAMAV